MVSGISHDIAFGVCHVGCKDIPHDHVVCFLAMWYGFYPLAILGPEGYCPSLSHMSVHLSIHESGPLLGNYSWHLLHIFETCQLYMEPVYCNVNLTFWPSILMLWPLPWHNCLEHFWDTINGKCFILLVHINLTWDLSTVWSFWPFDLCPWYYNHWLWNLVDKLLFSLSEGIHCQRHVLTIWYAFYKQQKTSV